MTLAVEKNEMPRPMQITRFGPRGVMPHAQHLAHLIEKPRRLWTWQLPQLEAQDMVVEQFQRRPRCLQGGERPLLGAHHMFQETTHGGQTQLPRMPFAVEQNV